MQPRRLEPRRARPRREVAQPSRVLDEDALAVSIIADAARDGSLWRAVVKLGTPAELGDVAALLWMAEFFDALRSRDPARLAQVAEAMAASLRGVAGLSPRDRALFVGAAAGVAAVWVNFYGEGVGEAWMRT